MRLSPESVRRDAAALKKASVALPAFDVESMRTTTTANPEWVHFGAGNIFRGFISSLNQRLLNEGLAKTGVVACEKFDYDILDRICSPHDNLALNVLLNPDGTVSKELLASVARTLKADFSDAASKETLKDVVWNDPASYKGQLRPLLANAEIFHVDYTRTPLADRIENYFMRLLSGPGAVRNLLRSECRQENNHAALGGQLQEIQKGIRVR